MVLSPSPPPKGSDIAFYICRGGEMYVQLLSLVISTQECRVLLSSTRDTEANGALLALRCAESSKFRKFLPAEPIAGRANIINEP